MNEINQTTFKQLFTGGGVFAYPTEAVFGLGCDPLNETAVNTILSMKQRPVEKGMILIAGDFAQVSDYIEYEKLDRSVQSKIQSSWPGPVTWLIPKSKKTPYWVSGDSDLVAVRVSNHPLVKALCETVQSPMISTSANPAGMSPALDEKAIHKYFQTYVDQKTLTLISGQLGKQKSPSKIFNALTLEMIRS